MSADGVLLLIQVIGQISGTRKFRKRIGQHRLHPQEILLLGQQYFLTRQIRTALLGKRMHRYVLRAQRNDLIQRPAEFLCAFSRKARDQIRIDHFKAHFPRHLKCRKKVIRRMPPPHTQKCRIAQCLRVDADPRDSEFPKHGELFFRDRIRASGLHTDLPKALHRRVFEDPADQFPKKFFVQYRGCTAPDIKCLDTMRDRWQHLLHLMNHCIHIRRKKFRLSRRFLRNKRTVCASCGAERNADVYMQAGRLCCRQHTVFLVPRHKGQMRLVLPDTVD